MEPLFTQRPLFEAVFWTACAIWIVPEIAGGLIDRLRHPAGRNERNFDAGSGSVILLGILLLPAAGIEVADRLTALDVAGQSSVLFAIGVGLLLLGVALRWHAVRSLGRHFSRSVAIQNAHEIVATGPYRLIRHPSYSGTLLTLLGVALAAGNWLTVLIMVAGGLAVYSYRVRLEERVLSRELGEPYLRYMARTRRFIPWLL